jgi:hypothetical protein
MYINLIPWHLQGKKNKTKTKTKTREKITKQKDISGSKSLLGKEAKMIGVLQSLFQ